MFTTVLSSLSVGTKFMLRDSIDIYCVTKVERGFNKTIVVTENLTLCHETIVDGYIRVMPLYSL